jgi:hypothetical protein
MYRRLMASIQCGQNLWRTLLARRADRSRGKAPVIEEPIFQNVVFGPWAATTARFDGRDLIIGIDAATYLTVVFRFNSRERFRRDFSEALSGALEDLGAPPRVIALETSVIELTPMIRLTDRTLSQTLQHVQWFCDLELDHHDDLRRVQRNLNEVPHAGRDPCVPAEAVAALVGRTMTEWNPASH